MLPDTQGSSPFGHMVRHWLTAWGCLLADPKNFDQTPFVPDGHQVSPLAQQVIGEIVFKSFVAMFPLVQSGSDQLAHSLRENAAMNGVAQTIATAANA